eukprot:gene1395-1611_t
MHEDKNSNFALASFSRTTTATRVERQLVQSIALGYQLSETISSRVYAATKARVQVGNGGNKLPLSSWHSGLVRRWTTDQESSTSMCCYSTTTSKPTAGGGHQQQQKNKKISLENYDPMVLVTEGDLVAAKEHNDYQDYGRIKARVAAQKRKKHPKTKVNGGTAFSPVPLSAEYKEMTDASRRLGYDYIVDVQHKVFNTEKEYERHESELKHIESLPWLDESQVCDVFDSIYRILPLNELPETFITVSLLGNQHSGKSTMLETLLGIELYDRDAPRCMRTVSVTCKRTLGDTYFEYNDGPYARGGRMGIEEVRSKLAHAVLSDPKDLVYRKPIEIVYGAPHLYNIRFIDTPSFSTEMKLHETNGQLMRSINATTEKLPIQQRMYIFCVEPSRDYDQETDFRGIRVCDPSFSSTIGVLNKLDLAEEGNVEFVSDIVSNRKYQLVHGWMGFRSRQPSDDSLLNDQELNDSATNTFRSIFKTDIKSGPKVLLNKIMSIYIKKNREAISKMLTKCADTLHYKIHNSIHALNSKVKPPALIRELTHPNSLDSIGLGLYIRKGIENEIAAIFDEELRIHFKTQDVKLQHSIPIGKRVDEATFANQFKELTYYLSRPIPIKIADTRQPLDYSHYGSQWLQLLRNHSTNERSMISHLHHHADTLKSHYNQLPEDIPSSNHTLADYEAWALAYRRTIEALTKRQVARQIPGIVYTHALKFLTHHSIDKYSSERLFFINNCTEIIQTLDITPYVQQITREQIPTIGYEDAYPTDFSGRMLDELEHEATIKETNMQLIKNVCRLDQVKIESNLPEIEKIRKFVQE